MSADLDLLRPSAPSAGPAVPRRSSASFFVGATLILGVLTAVFLLVKPALFPPRKVETGTVRVESGPARSAVAVEATGWVEPDPFPVFVRPLVDGTVDRFEVVEGTPVKAGETVLATLRSTMIEDGAEKVRASVAHTEAHLPEAKADLDQATALLEQKLDLRRDVARLEGERAVADADVAVTAADAKAAVARADAERLEWEAQDRLKAGGSGSDVLLARAVASLAAARADLESKTALERKARATLAALDAQLALAREALEHPVALEAAVAKTKAHWAAAQVEVAAAQVERTVAERDLARLIVRAPVDGVVLRRNAAPGSPVGPSRMARGEGGAQDAGEGTLLSIYDPSRIQARIDVPVGSVGGVGAGRKVELTAEALPGRVFHGVVGHVVSQADLLKNSLQVKVAITDPDPLLKPEMLVRARFLAAESAEPTAPAAGAARVLVPRRAVRGGAVFVFDPTGGGRARRIPVTQGAAEGDWVEVTGAISSTHRVILDDVVDDERVEVAP